MPTKEKKADHNLAAQAMELAVFGMPAPANPKWKKSIPTKDWRTARGAGSSNIPLFGAAADLRFATKGRTRDQAAERLHNYASICRREWWLSETESAGYGAWIRESQAAVVHIARQMGLDDLARQFMGLLEEDAQRSCLMAARLRHAEIPANQKAPRERYDRLRATIRAHVGQMVICRAGERSWSSGFSGGWGVDMAWQQIARAVLFDQPWPQPKGNPGDLDGYGHTVRVAYRLRGIFEEAAQDARQMTVDELVDQSRHWSPSRNHIQYLGWEDGSRLCVLGTDQEAFVDESLNSNTPAVMAFGISAGNLIYLPEWPNPWDGDEKIRQTNVKGDVDLIWSPSGPVRVQLDHSHIGRERTRDGYLRSSFELTDAALAFHLIQRPFREWENALGSEPELPPEVPPSSPPTVPPTKPPTTKPKEKPSWIERMGI